VGKRETAGASARGEGESDGPLYSHHESGINFSGFRTG